MPGQTCRPLFLSRILPVGLSPAQHPGRFVVGWKNAGFISGARKRLRRLEQRVRGKTASPSNALVYRLAPRGASQVRREACVQPSEPTDCPFSAGLCRSTFPLSSTRADLPPGGRRWGLRAVARKPSLRHSRPRDGEGRLTPSSKTVL
ncbi:hypothetical protein HMPREF0262_02219 [Clostridium sp. ATCC 29733]|nr:hypothetical protein HMPREF0262_02219 [Clostridium sp. ATCC 29733]